jgi:hypothetical protein
MVKVFQSIGLCVGKPHLKQGGLRGVKPRSEAGGMERSCAVDTMSSSEDFECNQSRG